MRTLESKSPLRAIFQILLCVGLVLALLPFAAMPPAQASPKHSTQTDADIVSLLEQGNYAEGEAVVIVDDTIDPAGIQASAVSASLDAAAPLMNVSEEVYEAAATGAAIEQGNAAQSTSVSSDDVSIRHITAAGMSTESLLYALRDDPRVLRVEPNYLYQLGEQDTAAISTQAALPVADTNDITDYQWGNDNAGTTMQVEGQDVGFDINPPTWNTADNATGTVAVMDTGVDYEHPDLKNIMRTDMKQFVSYGGAYGYNSSAEDDATDPMDLHSHGTHCAGIIASEWNSYGTSGVASGVKLVAVRAASKKGSFTSVSTLKGYAYLAEAMKNGLDLKAVNNSWGGGDTTLSFSVATTELGRLGAVTVVASGNETTNIDYNASSSATLHANPYAVIVNSSTIKSTLSSFSNYGAETTNIVAPGSGILSTVPLALGKYFPNAVANNKNLVFESFVAPSTTFVGYKDENLSQPVGAKATTPYCFDADGGSWNVSVSDVGTNDDVVYPNREFYATIEVPAAQQPDARYVGFQLYASGSKGAEGAFVYVKGKDSKGNAVWARSIQQTDRGEWSQVSIDLDELAITPTYNASDQLELKIVYVYMAGEPQATDRIYIDAVGVGPDGAAAPYAFMSGTSMATPAATGAAMVIATDDNPAQSASDQALLRAARLQGSVRAVAAFKDLCTSGGALDLNYFVNKDYAPVISNAVVDASSGAKQLRITGNFFGTTEGSVSIGGVPATVVSGTWSDTSVTVICPATIATGIHSVVLTAANGKAVQRTFLLELPDSPDVSTTPLYEITYEFPTGDGFPSGHYDSAIVGLGGYLYLFPSDMSLSGGVATMWMLDPVAKTWTKCPDLPEMMSGISAATYEGKIVITGVSLLQNVQVTYLFDPLTQAWAELPLSLPYFTNVVNCEEALYFIGGAVEGSSDNLVPIDAILSYDANAQKVKQIGALSAPAQDLSVTAYGNKVVAVAKKYDPSGLGANLISLPDGSVTDISASLPKFATEKQNNLALASLKSGVALCGASPAGDQDHDTFVLDANSLSGGSFAAFEKRISPAQLFSTKATANRGMLYATGSSYYEEGRQVLRATAVETLDQPGDLYAIVYENVEPQEHNNPSAYTAVQLPLSLNEPNERVGLKFAGWYTNPEYTGEPQTAIAEGTTGTVTLWAKWVDVSSNAPTKNVPDTGDGVDLTLPIILAVIVVLCGIGIVVATIKTRRKK